MIDHGKTRSTVMPELIAIDDFSVWANSDIQPIIENDTGFIGFEYNMVQYDKDEYIKIMDTKNESLQEQLINTQFALCEIYEGMM